LPHLFAWTISHPPGLDTPRSHMLAVLYPIGYRMQEMQDMWALGKLALALVVSVGCVVGTAASQTSKEITVFAAASLTNALQEIADRFTEKTGTQVKLSFASSSTLAKQIESGAGAQLFLSADEAWMDYLEKAGLIA